MAGPIRPVGETREDFGKSWTSGKNGAARWRGVWRCLGRNHSSRWLRVGYSGGDHSKSSSSTEDAEKISVHPSFSVDGFQRQKGGEPVQSSASDAANDMLSSRGSSSDPPNETKSLAMAEGHWPGRVKRMGEASLCGETEARGACAGVSSLASEHWVPLPHCFFSSRLLGRRKWEGARGGVALCKESNPRAQRGETHVLAVRTIHLRERVGFPHTHCACHQRAGVPCTSHNSGTSFESMQWKFALRNLLF